MLRANIFAIISIIFSGSTTIHADIIPEIKNYLFKNTVKIKEGLPIELTAEEMVTLAYNITDNLLKRYNKHLKDINRLESRQELAKFILINVLSNYADNRLENLLRDEEAVQKIINKYSGALKGDMIRIKYKNYDLPLKVLFRGDKLVFKLIGTSLPLNDAIENKTCLIVAFDPQKNTLEIEWIGTLTSACPIPVDAKAGDFLLSLGEDLGKTLGATQIKLEDQSRILCDRNQKLVDLRTLRIFQNKQGWYQSKGYKPAKDKFLERLNIQWEGLRALKLSEVKSKLSSLESSLQQKLENELNIFVKQLKSFSTENQSDLLADFMNWLWERNCEAYTHIYSLIFDHYFFGKPLTRTIQPKLVKDLS